jgi:tetratricopeptide (TPR) repeat protein
MKSGDLRNAEVYYNQSLKIAQEMNDSSFTARAYVNLAAVYYDSNNFIKSIEFARRGISLAKEYR